MSSLADQFEVLYNQNLPDNITKQISPTKHREVEEFIKNNAIWSDEIYDSGYTGKWELLGDDPVSPSSGGFTVEELDSSINNALLLHRNSISSAFNTTINKIAGISLTNYVGEKLILEIDSYGLRTSYVEFEIASSSGTLTTLVIGEEYTIGFMYGDLTATVSNFFCDSWSQVKSAVASANASNGGNIYMSDDIILTEDVTWDVTNISFFGSTNCRWRVLNTDYVSDGTSAYKVTISAGSTSFSNVQFRGSGGGAGAQLFELYTSRNLFYITSGDSDMTFNTCLFKDIIGGAGDVPQIEYSKLTSGTGSELNFNGCKIQSANNSVAFDMNGFAIKTSSHAGNLGVSVINQRVGIIRSGIDNTDIMYSGNLDSPSLTQYYHDGTAINNDEFNSINTVNPISISTAITPLLTDNMSIERDGVIFRTTLAELKTLFGL